MKPAIITLNLLLLGSFCLSAERITVEVEKGDTLYSIGREYGVSVQQLIEVNGILNPKQLRSGTEIVVPFTHEVEKGDTLYGISREFDLSIDELSAYNDIDPDDAIKVGQLIRIPPSDRVDPTQEPLSRPHTAVASEESAAERTVRDEHKKADAQSNEVQEVRYEKGADEGSLMWPHSGKRVKLTGKLKGTQIEGEVGDRITAVSSGKVVWVAPYRGYGELVMVENSNGHIYAYGGNEETFVDVGDRVEAGTVIGRLGLNPVGREARVFFFVYRDGQPVDPEKAPRG